MDNVDDILSLKKSNPEWVAVRIEEKKDFIKSNLDNMLTDIHTMRDVGTELISLAAFKDVALIMQTVNYKAYAESGKHSYYLQFLQNLES